MAENTSTNVGDDGFPPEFKTREEYLHSICTQMFDAAKQLRDGSINDAERRNRIEAWLARSEKRV